MKKTTSIIITVALVIGIGIMFFGQSKNGVSTEGQGSAKNIEIRDGVQYVTINARGGYSPKVTSARAHVPTKLIVKTNGTYDCSSSLVIRAIGYQKILPNTGEEIIDLGTPNSGTIKGLCSMGMYNFSVNFN